ncbi:hypothetical protein D047_1806A, partial [Vibrio parahaemolyticus VPTS-2010_2]
MKPRVSSET